MRAENPWVLLLESIQAEQGTADTRVEGATPTTTADNEGDPDRKLSGIVEASLRVSDTPKMRNPGPEVGQSKTP
jgi:hypothetical protein